MNYLEDAFFRPFTNKKMRRLRNRADAGHELAEKLAAYANRPDVVVLGLARGGVPVAYEIATVLHAPLDVLIVRKLGVPGHEELAMGAIASGGIHVLNTDVVEHLAIPGEVIDRVTEAETQELTRREQVYRGDRPATDISKKTVILADDGIATGATLRAAIAAVRTQDPARLVVAVGVAPPETYEQLVNEVDEFVYVLLPEPFGGGLWFQAFPPTSDEEVRMLLERAQRQLSSEDSPSRQLNSEVKDNKIA